MENTKDKQQYNPWNEYIRNYRRKNPDKVQRYKLNGARRLLEKNGFKVIAPESIGEKATGEA